METLSRRVLTFLLNALWQVTLLALVAALGARLLRKSPARYRHIVWVMALGASLPLPLGSMLHREHQSPQLPGEADQDTGRSPQTMLSTPALQPRLTDETPPPHSRLGRTWTWLRARLDATSRTVHIPHFWAWAALGCYLLSLLLHSGRLWRAWRKTVDVRASAFAREIPESLAAVAGARFTPGTFCPNSAPEGLRLSTPKWYCTCVYTNTQLEYPCRSWRATSKAWRTTTGCGSSICFPTENSACATSSVYWMPHNPMSPAI